MMFTLVPAVPADAQALHDLQAAAFASDAHTLMKVHEKGAGASVSGELAPVDEIRSWIARPEKCVVLKAVDDDSGEILGWAGWGLWHYDGSHPALPEGEEDPRVKDPAPWLTKPAASAPRVEHLSYLNSHHFAMMDAKLCPLGTRALYCVSIGVHPAHQGRGVGGALVRWVCAKSDADGVPAWVHASEGAHPLFAHAGFEVVETLVLDLDKWATQDRIVEGEKKPWGTYTFRYMVRQPQKSA